MKHLLIAIIALSLSVIVSAQAQESAVPEEGYQAHHNLFVKNRFPSALECAQCHQTQFQEWSVSQHAYAQLSPVYMAMQNKQNKMLSGSLSDFCIRCHTQPGMALNEPPMMANEKRHSISREGVTCVSCHRVSLPYNKVSSRFGMEQGDVTEPFYGPTGNAELARVLESSEEFKVTTDPKTPGRKIHREIKFFQPIRSSTFCGSCHDVTSPDNFRLEEAFSDYRMSRAPREAVSCQDCHMGKIPGIPSGYNEGPAAVIDGVPTKNRRLTNHTFVGPDYSIIHPGIFPINPKAQELATLEDWLLFDHKAGWGTDEFEAKVTSDQEFPEVWSLSEDRRAAREILNEQFKLLAIAKEQRYTLLRNGYQLGNIKVLKSDAKKLNFSIEFKSGTTGHNIPTGFIAERLVWLSVEVRDSTGAVIFQSGDTDPNGDVRDHESFYVQNGQLPLDDQLFSLQGRFIAQNRKGGDREQILAIPYSHSALPRVLPPSTPNIWTGETRVTRIHRRSIVPLGKHIAHYRVPSKSLTGHGPYTIKVRIYAQMVPVNLIHEVSDVGFMYNMSAKELATNLVDERLLLWEKEVEVP